MKINAKKGINAVIMIIATLGLATITIAIYAIIVQAFRNSQGGIALCGLNSTGGLANPAYTHCGLAYNISNAGLGLFTGLTGQFSTIGQVSGVLVLFAVMALFGIGGYMAYQNMGGKKP